MTKNAPLHFELINYKSSLKHMELNKIIFLHAVLPVFQQPRRKIVCISEMHLSRELKPANLHPGENCC